MSRFLMAPFAPTSGLAHLGACVAVGKELRERGHEVGFGYGGSFPALIEREGFDVEHVLDVPAEREWHPEGWFRTSDDLRRLVDSNLELIARIGPDAVVTSSGVASRLACELAGVPEVHLMHYLPYTPEGRSRALMWRTRLRDARHPRRVLRRLRARVRPRRDGTVGTRRLIDQARRELGLPTAAAGAIGGTRGSLIALTTTPLLDPAAELPEHWRYVGPVTWSAPAEGFAPARGDRPLIYLTQGSTGSAELLRRAVIELAEEPLELLVSTGGLVEAEELERLAPNVRADALLPGRACLEAADAAIIHGGHLTSLEALKTATPVAVIPFRSNQFAQASRVERLGTGIGLWPGTTVPGAMRKAVRRLLARRRYRRRAAEVAAHLRDGWDGPRNAADLIEEIAA
jgi:MGT family glycosyltransferase